MTADNDNIDDFSAIEIVKAVMWNDIQDRLAQLTDQMLLSAAKNGVSIKDYMGGSNGNA